MRLRSGIERALGIEKLRLGLLSYSREAYARLPRLDRPRILDIGCGSGLTTIELAQLSDGEIVGIDTDESALRGLRGRTERAGLRQRVTAVHASLYETGFPDESFDLLWEEGVLHLLDPSRSFAECHRLLKPGGFLVMGETVAWFEKVRERLWTIGFGLVEQHPLPRHCWWTDFYAPLEARIRTLREERDDVADSAEFRRYEREVAMVKADPGRFDCGFFIISKGVAGSP